MRGQLKNRKKEKKIFKTKVKLVIRNFNSQEQEVTTMKNYRHRRNQI